MSELLKINVNEHTEKKGGLTYLSWAWAWAEVLKYDPLATWCAHSYGPEGSVEPFMRIGETAMVHTSVTIKGLRRECMLPVMDNRNNAVKNPDARKISDAIMRCMTKAIAMHGLGLYIYAGEDLPEADEIAEPRAQEAQTKGPFTVTEQKQLKAVADECIQLFKEENEWGAFESCEAFLELMSAGDKAEEAKLALWEQFKPYPALRSSLKRSGEMMRTEKARLANVESK